MALIRGFSRLEKDGRIKLLGNIQRAAGIKKGQLVELKIVGTGKKSILITARDAAR